MTSSTLPHGPGARGPSADDGLYVPPPRRSRWSEPWVRWTTLGVAGGLLLTVVGVALFFAPSAGDTDYIEVYITDVPGGFDKVHLRVGGVYVDAAGHPLRLENAEFDILQYRGTQNALRIASGDVPHGEHTQLAIVFTSAKAHFGGQWFPIKVPQKMLKITGGLDLKSRESAVLLDLDMDKSLVLTADGYSFMPYVSNLYTHDFTQGRDATSTDRPGLEQNGFRDPPLPDPTQELDNPPPGFGGPTSPSSSNPPPPPCTQECGGSSGPGSGGNSSTPTPGILPEYPGGTPVSNCDERFVIEEDDTPQERIQKTIDKTKCQADYLVYQQYKSLDQNMTWIVRLAQNGGPIPYRTVTGHVPSGQVQMPLSLGTGVGPQSASAGPSAAIQLDPLTRSVLNREQLTAAATLAASYGGQPLYAYATSPAIVVQMSPSAAWDLSQDNAVEWVEFAGAPALPASLPSAQSNTMWAALQQGQSPGGVLNHRLLPYDGHGVGIGVIDVGVDGTHPDLAFDVLGLRQAPVGSSPLVIYENIIPLAVAQADRVPNTDTVSGHGTLVAGLIFGQPSATNAAQHGFAPGAKGFECAAGVGMTLLQLTACMDKITYYKINPKPGDPPILVVTNSWVTPPESTDTNGLLYQQVDRLVDLGVTVIFAAGNSGGDGTSATTSIMCQHPREGVICSGGFEDSDLYDRSRGTVYYASSRGRVDQPWTWPDVCAPATRLRSPYPVQLSSMPTSPYAVYSGTSIAAPIVASTVALMQQARLDAGKQPLAPADVERILEGTAYKFPSGGPYQSSGDARYNGAYYLCGHGLLDIQGAVNTALAAP